jgi:propanol-preferring alcohol dehydrogenase
MQAAVVDLDRRQVRLETVSIPRPQPGELLIRVEACALCRTDLHILDRELPPHRADLIPGHQVVGTVVEKGSDTREIDLGQRVGVAWLAAACETCAPCRAGFENLCPAARFTGYDLNGGLAEYLVADSRFVFPVSNSRVADQIAPMLCGGMIGYRALKLAGDGALIGMYGFGAAAHLLTQLARFQGRRVFAFTKPGDRASQQFALQQGAVWAGASDQTPPEPLDAALIFAPVGALVPRALGVVRPGGRVVCAGIHMSEIPSFPYELLWHERALSSVANLTRADGREFLKLAEEAKLQAAVSSFSLSEAPGAIDLLRSGGVLGTLVMTTSR